MKHKPKADASAELPYRQHRIITIFQARQLALEILELAELNRIQFAEEEARRGIDWEQL